MPSNMNDLFRTKNDINQSSSMKKDEDLSIKEEE